MNVLANIARQRRAAIKQNERDEPLASVQQQARQAPPLRDFAAALQTRLDAGQTAAIAEIKFASPSAGTIRPASSNAVTRIAEGYAAAGAACLSVLTEPSRFSGKFDYLGIARQACDLPILCKDFVLSPWQIHKARACGADAVLLIVAMLPGDKLLQLAALAHQVGLAVLVEVHTAEELDWAVQQPLLDQAILGLNNRNLKTLQTQLSVTRKLADRIPSDRLCVSESGIESRADIAKLARWGIHSILIGESLMRSDDPGQQLKKLLRD